VDFRDAVAAEKARGIYNDWQGWGPKGLQIEFTNPGGDLAQGAGAKRGREGAITRDFILDRTAGSKTDQIAQRGRRCCQPTCP
jgi:hypothetical protein